MTKQNESLITFKNLLLFCMAVVLLYLLTCKKKTEVAPMITPSTEQIKVVNLAEEQRKHMEDSFNLVLRKHYKQDYQDSNYLIQLLNQNSELVSINTRLQNEVYPDTCKEIVSKYQKAYDLYAAQTKKTLDQCRASTSNLSSTIQTQKKYLSAKDSAYAKIKTAWDTCISGYQKLEKAVKKLQPHNKLAVGVVGNVYPIFGYGVGLDFIHKKGIVISASAMMMNNQTYGQVGIKKVISFRK